ncbi:zinc ribbon domain-containing protein [Ruminococcaceae bacterium OttesenSCG-928-N02]|nr:zinc ribbon domain-containing protein [Ruminococcaceae bacterium OttesenSCG-928-N02]
MNIFDKFSKAAGNSYESYRLSWQLSTEQSVMEDLKENLGVVAYKQYLAGTFTPTGELKELCDKIKECESKIDEMKAYKETLKISYRKTCPSCGYTLEDGFHFCPECGADCTDIATPCAPEPTPPASACPACGTEPQKEGQHFCHKCGMPL